MAHTVTDRRTDIIVAIARAAKKKFNMPILLTASIAGLERNWWSDCDECHLESFLVWYTTEDSFIIGLACGKKWEGAQKPESLGV